MFLGNAYMKKQDIGNPREQKFLADGTLGNIMSKEAALSRSIRLVNLINNNAVNLLLRSYFHYFGGFASHGREVLFNIGENYQEINIKADPLPTPVDVDPFTEQKINFYSKNPLDKEQAIHLNIACPAHSQYYPLQKCAHSIMWTMTETEPMSKHYEPGSYIYKWLERVDEVWVPTDMDMKRFGEIVPKGKLFKMNLGIRTDQFHKDVSPLDITNTKDKLSIKKYCK